MNANITIREMRMEDIDSVLNVEQNSFPTPWSREVFINELTQNRYANYFLILKNNKVIGYCGMWIIVDEAHVTNIAILPAYRGTGLGETLMLKVIEVARAIGAMSMTLEVRISNVVAQNMYRKFGFKIGGIRKRYYSDNKEDAYVMWVKFNE